MDNKAKIVKFVKLVLEFLAVGVVYFLVRRFL